MGARIYTKRIRCGFCFEAFTITSAASKFCKFCKRHDCVRKRRKADRQARKEAEAQRAVPGSDQHLARALRTGE